MKAHIIYSLIVVYNSLRARPPTLRVYPLLFTNSVWVLYRPTVLIKGKDVRRGLRFIVFIREDLKV